MIRIVAGVTGEGKTKRLIDMANTAVKQTKGHIVFIDNSKRYMYDLNHDIRFISTKEFPLYGCQEFYGFVCGIMSEDHDIEEIYFDGLLKLANVDLDQMQDIITKLRIVSDQYNVRFVISVTCTTKTLPDELKEYLVA